MFSINSPNHTVKRDNEFNDSPLLPHWDPFNEFSRRNSLWGEAPLLPASPGGFGGPPTVPRMYSWGDADRSQATPVPQDEHGEVTSVNALFSSTPFTSAPFFNLAEPNYQNDDEESLSGENFEEKEEPMEAAHLQSKCEHPNIGNFQFCPNCGIPRTSIATTTTTQPDPVSSWLLLSTSEVQSAAVYASANPIPVANPIPLGRVLSPFSFRPAKPNRTEICKMNTAALREHLRRLGLDTSGVCHDMKNRIREHWGHPRVKSIPKEHRKPSQKKSEVARKRQRNARNQFVSQKKLKLGGL